MIVSYLHSRLSVVDRLVVVPQWSYVCDPLLRSRKTLRDGTLQVENEKDEKSHAKPARQKHLHFSEIFNLPFIKNVLDEKKFWKPYFTIVN